MCGLREVEGAVLSERMGTGRGVVLSVRAESFLLWMFQCSRDEQPDDDRDQESLLWQGDVAVHRLRELRNVLCLVSQVPILCPL